MIPVAVAGVGTCLDEAEGNAGRGKCMARTSRSDERIDISAYSSGIPRKRTSHRAARGYE